MYEAVVFFDDGNISKEMRFSEFEAVLDGYVGMPELSDSSAECCYLLINKDLSVGSAVFFLLSFDTKGMPDTSWDIPIEMMAKDAEAGRYGIGLVTRSNCPVPQYANQLWEPDSDVVVGQLVSAIQRNKLAFKAEKPVDNIPTINEQVEDYTGNALDLDAYSQDVEKRVERLKEAYKKRLHSFENHRKQEVEHLVALLNNERNAHHERKSEVDKLQEELSAHLDSAQEEITGQQKSLDRMASEKSDLELIIANQKTDIIDLQAQISELNNQVSEIAVIEERFLHEKESMVSKLVEKLTELDIVFVAYSPGAGHMSLDAIKLMDYLEQPVKYAAEKCHVTEEQYRLWQAHFNNPVCDECGDKITKVVKPDEFQRGMDNHCFKHKKPVN